MLGHHYAWCCIGNKAGILLGIGQGKKSNYYRLVSTIGFVAIPYVSIGKHPSAITWVGAGHDAGCRLPRWQCVELFFLLGKRKCSVIRFAYRFLFIVGFRFNPFEFFLLVFSPSPSIHGSKNILSWLLVVVSQHDCHFTFTVIVGNVGCRKVSSSNNKNQ